MEWSKFGTYQQGKIIQVWDSLTSDLRKQITDKIKNISVELENERKQWNVDDWARLIHIWADPNNASVVTKTTEPLTRTELDQRHTHYSPWEQLANNMNDMDMFKYHNVTFTVNESNIKLPNIGKETSFELCSTFNPSNRDRPFRTGDIIKTKMRHIKTEFSKAYANFKRSGYHDTEDLEREFFNFCGGDTTLLYAFVVWSHLNITQLGKLLPEEASFESGIEGTPTIQRSHHVVRKRKNSEVSTTSNSPDIDDSSLTSKKNDSSQDIFAKSYAEYQKSDISVRALDILYNSSSSNEDVKKAAQAKLLQMAGVQMHSTTSSPVTSMNYNSDR